MLKASDFDDGVILGGEEGAATQVTDIRVNKQGNFDVLEFYVKASTRLKGTVVDEGFEPIDESEVVVKMWIPLLTLEQEKKEKKVKANNSMLSRLSGGKYVDPTAEDAWIDALPGGELHEAILEHSQTHVVNKEYNGNKNWQFEFNADKPKVKTKEEFLAEYQKRQQKAAEEAAKSPF